MLTSPVLHFDACAAPRRPFCDCQHDSTGDGNFDTVYQDTTGDGNIDTAAVDTTGDGKVDTVASDTTGDGKLDTAARDTDGESRGTPALIARRVAAQFWTSPPIIIIIPGHVTRRLCLSGRPGDGSLDTVDAGKVAQSSSAQPAPQAAGGDAVSLAALASRQAAMAVKVDALDAKMDKIIEMLSGRGAGVDSFGRPRAK